MTRVALPLGAVAGRLRDAQLLLGLEGPEDVMVTGVSQDSREVVPGDLFLAWKGSDFDAHEFLPQAAEAGAVAAVVERFISEENVCQLRVRDGRLAGALAADFVCGSPWKKLFLAGVTGTNGKTTVAVLARHLLQEKGRARALGTLGLVEESGFVRAGTEGLTTPGPVQISGWLREMAEEGVTYATLEASSHALAQDRLAGLRLDVAVFTNLSRDHLDYHADLDSYRSAKGRALGLLKPEGWAVVNRDEAAWNALSFPQERTISFGFGENTPEAGGGAGPGERDLRADAVEVGARGSSFRLSMSGEEAHVSLPLLGRFNVENALAAAAIGTVAGLSLPEIARSLASAPQIPGRLERVQDAPFTVLIDFAHTPDALERVLRTLRPLVSGRMLVLFGAGGDRDRGKRPRMGAVVAREADLAFVTSDNPRSEDPEVIIDDVVEGMGEAPYRRFADRKEAIGAALEEAGPDDLLLLAGKGHETSQVLGREKHPFDEREIVKEIVARRKLAGGIVAGRDKEVAR